MYLNWIQSCKSEFFYDYLQRRQNCWSEGWRGCWAKSYPCIFMINSKCSLTKRLVFITFKLSKQIIISKVRLDMNVHYAIPIYFNCNIFFPICFIILHTHIMYCVVWIAIFHNTSIVGKKMIMNVRLVFSYCSVDHANQLQYPTSCES